MISYNPKDWYWFVAGNETQVFSSKRGDFVQVDDPAYQGWLASGGATSRIVSAAELGEVLAPYNIRPLHAATLDGYTETQARKLTLEVVAKALFNVVNRVLVLENKAPLTANQFKNYLKGLM